ncbi:MAG: DUF1874 domain-containing protein [Gammaproteobacteria bacterium]|nr:DUF1874 domain-containing protein [Gammaproteobacteria bacterium]MBU1655155.1 DUF1874 domain-containing protein [Gammaproteobacteria bacterium]MBU1959966.1 DUF1874 domain-containing protein [Gammaproteobacteria bacterium]
MSILLNAFSANMVAEFPCSVKFTEISAETARINLLLAAEEVGEAEMIRSAVGHPDTAAVFESVLGVPVECRRETITLKAGDDAVVGQYTGPRLPEGCKALPEGAAIRWLYVTVSAA